MEIYSIMKTAMNRLLIIDIYSLKCNKFLKKFTKFSQLLKEIS